MSAYNFFKRKQDPDESFNIFYLDLKHLIKAFQLWKRRRKPADSSQISVLGMNCKTSKKHLLGEQRTLNHMNRFCKLTETTKTNIKVLSLETCKIDQVKIY